MAQGLERWGQIVDGTEAWFARVELDDEKSTTLTKTEYDAAGYSPPFWQLRRMLRPCSAIVAEGMKRVCKDFSDRVSAFGFRKTRSRLWTRVNKWSIDSIHFHRHGSSYGAPINASVDLRLSLGISVLNDPAPGGGIGVLSDPVRRMNGRAYHHRFNAETWSTYDGCVEELVLFMTEFAEPWFAEWRDPQNLMTHSQLRQSTQKLLQEALDGHSNPESIAASLKALGIKRQPPNA